MWVAVGVSVGRAIAVAVISAITVARMSGVRVGVWVTVGVAVGVGVSVGSGVGVAVGETAMSETSSGSVVGAGVGGSQFRKRASARARATGFSRLVVFNWVRLGVCRTAGSFQSSPSQSKTYSNPILDSHFRENEVQGSHRLSSSC